MERDTRIELAFLAWEASVLPLYESRTSSISGIIRQECRNINPETREASASLIFRYIPFSQHHRGNDLILSAISYLPGRTYPPPTSKKRVAHRTTTPYFLTQRIREFPEVVLALIVNVPVLNILPEALVELSSVDDQ